MYIMNTNASNNTLFTLTVVCTWYESFCIYLNLSSYYHMHVVGLGLVLERKAKNEIDKSATF